MSCYTMHMVTVQKTLENHAKIIAENLQQKGHAVGTQDVMPTTAETTIPKTPEMHELGAEVIGEDLSHIVGAAVGEMTTGSRKYRVTKSGRFLQLLKEKLSGKKEK